MESQTPENVFQFVLFSIHNMLIPPTASAEQAVFLALMPIIHSDSACQLAHQFLLFLATAQVIYAWPTAPTVSLRTIQLAPAPPLALHLLTQTTQLIDVCLFVPLNLGCSVKIWPTPVSMAVLSALIDMLITPAELVWSTVLLELLLTLSRGLAKIHALLATLLSIRLKGVNWIAHLAHLLICWLESALLSVPSIPSTMAMRYPGLAWSAVLQIHSEILSPNAVSTMLSLYQLVPLTTTAKQTAIYVCKYAPWSTIYMPIQPPKLAFLHVPPPIYPTTPPCAAWWPVHPTPITMPTSTLKNVSYTVPPTHGLTIPHARVYLLAPTIVTLKIVQEDV